MKLKFALSILGSAAALTLAGCGGGGGGGGGGGVPVFPVTPTTPATPAPETPAPVTPTPEPEVPVVEAPKTWQDTDCEQIGEALPACTSKFSSNDAGVTVGIADGGSVLRFATGNAPLAEQNDNTNEVKGNLAALGLKFLHGVKLSDLPAFKYTLKQQSEGSIDQSLNITFSKECDLSEGGSNAWTNPLVVRLAEVTSTESASHVGYRDYAVSINDEVWVRSGNTQLTDIYSNPVLNALGSTPNTPTSLAALIAAYPNACVFNYSNPGADREGPLLTPGVLIKLGNSTNIEASEYTLKSLRIGDKVIFESKPVTPD